MHSGGHAITDILKAKNLGELSEREMYISTLVANGRDSLDQLRSALQDQSVEQAKLAKARDLTKARRKDAGNKLKALAGQLKVQAQLQGALDARIADYAAEAEAAASEEGNIQKLLAKSQGGDTGPASAAGLIWPCRGPLTSGFGMRWGRMHQGQDIACGYGTPIHAAKAGTVCLMKTMAIEPVQHGIRVNSISPGPSDTQQSVDLVGEETMKKFRENFSVVPMGRLGRPSDMADMSDASDWVHPAALTAEGSRTEANRIFPCRS